MRVTEIQSNLLAILRDIPLFATVKPLLFVDDGLKNEEMEAALNTEGFCVLIMQPQGLDIADKGRGAVVVDYVCDLLVRTNPKVKTDAGPKWNPLACESEIMTAVMQWSKARSDFGFKSPPGEAPMYLAIDAGNNSRLIPLMTAVHYH